MKRGLCISVAVVSVALLLRTDLLAETPALPNQIAQTGKPIAGEAAPLKKPAPGTTRAEKKLTPSDSQVRKVSEAEALAFAREHHPELAHLLDALRGMERRHFDEALKELTREVERLVRMQERDPDRYPLSLELWKLDSRIRLEVARFSTSKNEDFTDRLKPLVHQRREVRLQLLELERSKAMERIARLDDQLTAMRNDPNEQLTQEINGLRKAAIARNRTKPEPVKKPAVKAASVSAEKEKK